jgi:CheY-specific phosphatase CheX
MFAEAVGEVLETMCFTALGEGGGVTDGAEESWVTARLSFRGDPPGRFGVGVPPQTGRAIAASFLGREAEEVSEAQIGEVVCELANMVCGSVLSRLESQTRFDLSCPEPETGPAGWLEGHGASSVFTLEEGPLAVWMDLEPAP